MVSADICVIGCDINGDTQSTEDQVQRLIQEATSHENLAQGTCTIRMSMLQSVNAILLSSSGYVLGWMPYW